MTDDSFLSEHWRRFADVAREDLIPKVRESSNVMSRAVQFIGLRRYPVVSLAPLSMIV